MDNLSEFGFAGCEMVMLPDRQLQTVMNFRDLLDIIDRGCGFEVRNIVRDCIRDLETEKEELELEVKDYQRTLECNGEEERELLLSIRDEAEDLLDEVSMQRLNRRKLQKITRSLYQMVNEEL